MKVVLFVLSCLILAARGQDDELDHCPLGVDDNLFADKIRIPDSALSDEAKLLRSGQTWRGTSPLVLTIPLNDETGASPVITKIKLLSNARVTMQYRPPASSEFRDVPAGTWSHRSEYTLRTQVRMSHLKLSLGRRFNSGDTTFTARDLRVFGCDTHYEEYPDEEAGDEQEWEDVEW